MIFHNRPMKLVVIFILLALAHTRLCAEPTNNVARLDWQSLRNPVWVAKDNLRDPSVLKTGSGYQIFYSRCSGNSSGWGNPKNWAIACATTTDFRSFQNDHDISAKGYASPGDVVFWHGRWVLPYQTYPANPCRLCFSESSDLTTWSAPKYFLDEARHLSWNKIGRLIDPSFVIAGDTLHCFFVGSAFNTNADKKTIRGNLLGHAITRDPDLQHWEILTKDAPLIGVSERAPDGVENIMVSKTGDRWTMIFSEGLAAQHLAYAISPDLLTWEIKDVLDIPRQRWNAVKSGAPYVWREPDQWLMLLMGTDKNKRTSFGLLTSPDGMKWQMLPETAN